MVQCDPVITQSIAQILKRKFGSKNDRRYLEEILLRRSQMFCETGRIETGHFMAELPMDLKLAFNGGDSET